MSFSLPNDTTQNVKIGLNEMISAPTVNRAVNKLMENDKALSDVAGKLYINSSDPTAGTLADKFVAGAGVNFDIVLNNGVSAYKFTSTAVNSVTLTGDLAGMSLSALVLYADQPEDRPVGGTLIYTGSPTDSNVEVSPISVNSLSAALSTLSASVGTLSNPPFGTLADHVRIAGNFVPVNNKTYLDSSTTNYSTPNVPGAYDNNTKNFLWCNKNITSTVNTWTNIFASNLNFPANVKLTKIFITHMLGATVYVQQAEIVIDFVNKKIQGDTYNTYYNMRGYYAGTFDFGVNPTATCTGTPWYTNIATWSLGTLEFSSTAITKLPLPCCINPSVMTSNNHEVHYRIEHYA